MTDPLTRRSPALVYAILGYVYGADRPVAWLEALDLFTDDDHPWRTVENTLYDLIAYGALHRIGQPGTTRRPDSRALKPTPLGQAWLAQTIHPLPPEPTTS